MLSRHLFDDAIPVDDPRATNTLIVCHIVSSSDGSLFAPAIVPAAGTATPSTTACHCSSASRVIAFHAINFGHLLVDLVALSGQVVVSAPEWVIWIS